MWRFISYLLGLAALALLAFVCVKRHVPQIETGLLQSSSAVLFEHKLTDWASVAIDGRDLSLLGEAPDDATRQRAVALLQGVDGVRRVKFETVEPSIAKVVPPAFPDPYQFKADYDGSQLILSGYSPSIESRSIVVKTAEELFGVGNVSEQITVTQGGPDYWRVKTIQTILASMTHHQSAQAELDNTQLTLSGQIASPELKAQIQSQLKQALPEGFVSQFDIVVAEPEAAKRVVEEPPVEESDAEAASEQADAAADCQQQFNQLLAEKNIHFKVAQSEINPVSMALLDELAASASQCQHANIEIAGHTDSSGDDMMNLELSHQRAQTVREALVSRGITSGRLSVKGYGESEPVADNSTPEGRALNRRIELNIPED